MVLSLFIFLLTILLGLELNFIGKQTLKANFWYSDGN